MIRGRIGRGILGAIALASLALTPAGPGFAALAQPAVPPVPALTMSYSLSTAADQPLSAPVAPNETIKSTITLTAPAPATIRNAIVWNVLPAGVACTDVTAMPSQAANFTCIPAAADNGLAVDPANHAYLRWLLPEVSGSQEISFNWSYPAGAPASLTQQAGLINAQSYTGAERILLVPEENLAVDPAAGVMVSPVTVSPVSASATATRQLPAASPFNLRGGPLNSPQGNRSGNYKTSSGSCDAPRSLLISTVVQPQGNNPIVPGQGQDQAFTIKSVIEPSSSTAYTNPGNEVLAVALQGISLIGNLPQGCTSRSGTANDIAFTCTLPNISRGQAKFFEFSGYLEKDAGFPYVINYQIFADGNNLSGQSACGASLDFAYQALDAAGSIQPDLRLANTTSGNNPLAQELVSNSFLASDQSTSIPAVKPGEEFYFRASLDKEYMKFSSYNTKLETIFPDKIEILDSGDGTRDGNKVTWSLNTIAPDNNVISKLVKLKIKNEANTTFTDPLNITSTLTYDSLQDSNAGRTFTKLYSHKLFAAVDRQIEIKDSSTSYTLQKGRTASITFKLSNINKNVADSQNKTLEVQFPDYISYISKGNQDNCAPNSTNNNVVECNLGTNDWGQNGTELTLQVKIKDDVNPPGGTSQGIATINQPNNEVVTTNNSVNFEIIVNAPKVSAQTFTANKTQLNPRDVSRLTYEVAATAARDFGADAKNVVSTISLPAGLTYAGNLSGTIDNAVISGLTTEFEVGDGGSNTITIPNLAAGKTASISFDVRLGNAPPAGTLTPQAQVTSYEDASGTAITASPAAKQVTLTVQDYFIDLGLTNLGATSQTLQPGASTTVNLKVKKYGSQPVTANTIVNLTPSGGFSVDASQSSTNGWTCTTSTCTHAAINSETALDVVLKLDSTATTASTPSFTATVVDSGGANDTKPNSVTFTGTVIVPEPSVTLNIPATARAGETVTLEATLANGSGAADLYRAQTKITIPNEVTFNPATLPSGLTINECAGVIYSGQTSCSGGILTWDFAGPLTANHEQHLTIPLTFPESTTGNGEFPVKAKIQEYFDGPTADPRPAVQTTVPASLTPPSPYLAQKTVSMSADLAVTLSHAPSGNLVKDAPGIITLTVTNVGLKPYTGNVDIDLVLSSTAGKFVDPIDLTAVSGTWPASATFTDGQNATIPLTGLNLNSGDNMSVTFPVTLASEQALYLTVTARTPPGTDPYTENNTAREALYTLPDSDGGSLWPSPAKPSPKPSTPTISPTPAPQPTLQPQATETNPWPAPNVVRIDDRSFRDDKGNVFQQGRDGRFYWRDSQGQVWKWTPYGYVKALAEEGNLPYLAASGSQADNVFTLASFLLALGLLLKAASLGLGLRLRARR